MKYESVDVLIMLHFHNKEMYMPNKYQLFKYGSGLNDKC